MGPEKKSIPKNRKAGRRPRRSAGEGERSRGAKRQLGPVTGEINNTQRQTQHENGQEFRENLRNSRYQWKFYSAECYANGA